MPYQPTTNFKDSNGVDLGKKLVTKDYLLSVYSALLESSPANLSFSPALLTWGNNQYGKLGTNDTINRSTPVTTFLDGLNWRFISCVDDDHTAAIKNDGTLWTWGRNNSGQLGNNATTNRSVPVTTLSGGTNWLYVSVQDANTAAIKTDGTLWTWGSNLFNQLGTSGGDRLAPANLVAGSWKQVSCGLFFTAAIKTDGTLWTWGWNNYAVLGTNDTFTRTTPVTTFLGGTDWNKVSSGNTSVAAIKTDGTLWVWGDNSEGQLGINESGANTGRTTPVTTFAGGNNWKSVSMSGGNVGALKNDGTLWVWGDNINGQLGVNDDMMRSTPITTIYGGTSWKEVCCGVDNMFAIRTDGSFWNWGFNTNGNLGTNDTRNRSTPVTTFLGGNEWKKVAASSGIKSVDYV